MLQNANKDAFEISFCHSPSDGACVQCVSMPSILLLASILGITSLTSLDPLSWIEGTAGKSTIYRISSLLIPALLCNSALWPTDFNRFICRCKLKSRDTTGTLRNKLSDSIGKVSKTQSAKMTMLSTPPVLKGSGLSQAASSTSPPGPVLAPGLAAAGCFGGGPFSFLVSSTF